jgi:hypothetical protein
MVEKPTDLEECPDAENAYRTFLMLLPRGRAWNTSDVNYERDTNIKRFWSGIGITWSHLEAALCNSLNEWFCYSSDTDLDLWQLDYGIPDECDLYNASVCNKVQASHSISAEALVTLLQADGYSAEARWLTGDDLEFPGVYSTLYVQVDPYLSTAFTHRCQVPFYLGQGRRLGTPDASQIQCMLERYIPAHCVTQVSVAGSWTPMDLGSKLKGWLNATDVTEGPVTSWTARITANVLAPVTAGQNPVCANEAVGGYRFVNFNGTTQALRYGATGPPPVWSSNLVIAGLIRQDKAPTSGVNQVVVDYGKQAGTGDHVTVNVIGVAGTPVTNRLKNIASTSNLTDTSQSIQGYATFEAVYDSGSLLKLRIRGRDAVPATAPLVTLTVPSSPSMTVAASSDATAINYAQIGIRHLFFISSDLTPSEAMKLEAWMAWDINDPGNQLPPDHPYSNMRP